MGGAYTAQPGPAAVPNAPTDWNSNWPRTGPDPPGYNPDEEDYLLQLEVGNPGHVTVDEPSCYVAAKIYEDDGSFDSVNISNNSYITWYATIDEERILMNINGSWEYEPTTLASYLLGYGTFGANPEITFQVTEDDYDKDIIVDAIATVIRENDSVEESVEVLADATVSIPISIPYPVSAEAYVVVNSESYPPIGYHYWLAYMIVTKAGDGYDGEGRKREVFNNVITDSSLPSVDGVGEITTVGDNSRVDSSGTFDTESLWYNFYLSVSVSDSMDVSVTFYVKITWSDSTVEEYSHTTSDISSEASLVVKAYLDGSETGTTWTLH